MGSACTGDNDSQNKIYDFTVSNDEQNALRIIGKWTTRHPAGSQIEYREAEDTEIWHSTPLSEEKVLDHEVVVVGLNAASTYVLRPVSDSYVGDEIEISTKEMPASFPETHLIENSADATVDIIIVGLPSPISTIIAIGKDGKIIWYHEDSDAGDPGDFSVLQADGRLFYNTYESIKAVDYMGNEEVILDLYAIGEVVHHDFLITPEGSFMYLTCSTAHADHQNWCIDEIVERDADGNELWRWRTIDHVAELGGFVVPDPAVVTSCGID